MEFQAVGVSAVIKFCSTYLEIIVVMIHNFLVFYDKNVKLGFFSTNQNYARKCLKHENIIIFDDIMTRCILLYEKINWEQFVW